MVESLLEIQSIIDVTSTPKQELKLPIIHCAGKQVELHPNNKISLTMKDKTLWMKNTCSLNKFLDQNFTQIQKIEILKKIFHGIHTNERHDALRYLVLLRKKSKEK